MNNEYYVFQGDTRAKEKYDANKIHEKLIRNFMDKILELLSITGKKDIFEIGCGEGQIMGVLHQCGYSVAGMDYSWEAVDITKKNFRVHMGMDVDVKQGDIYEIKENLGGGSCLL